MVGHGGSSVGSYLADPTSPIPSHCASIIVTSTLRVNQHKTHTNFPSHSYQTLFLFIVKGYFYPWAFVLHHLMNIEMASIAQ